MMSQLWDNAGIANIHEQILEVFSEGIYLSDAKGKTLAINRKYEELTGLKKEEIMGRLVTDLKKRGVFNVCLNPEIVATGKQKTSAQVTKAGRNVFLHGYPIFNEAGKVALVLTFVRDITLMCQLKDQLARQQDIIEKIQCHHKDYKDKSSIIFKSKDMIKLIVILKKIAQTDATILLLGETGVGKDVIARKIHENSLRHNKPLLKVDCSSIPESLIESELFGYAPGAFSGANTKGKAGLLEMADEGTLFLDEIGEIPLQMQAKLLRVLQDQELIRVGSTKVKKVNIRFIAATNRALEEEVKKGNFRSDLYYRLHVAVFKVPALRERKEDIIAMSRCFLDKYNAKYRKNISFTGELEKALLSYKWPGNVRELDNFVQSFVLTHDSKILDVSDLPSYMFHGSMGPDHPKSDIAHDKSLKELVDDYEKELIKKALEQKGSVAKAAEILKVDRTTIFRKAKKYGLAWHN